MNLRSVKRLFWSTFAVVASIAAEPASRNFPPLPPPVRSVPPANPSGNIAVSAQTSSSGSPRKVVQASPVSPTNFAVAAPPLSQPGKPGVLEFDATSKHVDVAEGERKASFSFAVTNRSSESVTISYVNTSCGCTAGKLPSSPWVLKPGEGGYIDVTMDLTGKFGNVTKTATIVASSGSYPLSVSVSIPTSTATVMDRTRNTQIASADRQAVFRNDCATCHVQPAFGKVGRELYESACGICHEAEHRASMVPDLRTRLKNTDRNYWSKWIADGRVGSLMPAFASRNGGFLTDSQITSLVEYLEDDYKKNPPPSKFRANPTPAGTVPAQARPSTAP